MILCLSCRALSPTGSLYCQRCRKSFGVKRCPKGHPNPASARYCTQCASESLGPSTPYLPLGLFVRALTWLILLSCLKVAIAHGPGILGLILQAAEALFGFLFGEPATAVLHRIEVAGLQLYVFLLIYTAFAIGLKKNAWPLYRALFRTLWRLSVWLAKTAALFFRLLRRLAEGTPRQGRRDQRDGRDRPRTPDIDQENRS